MKFKLFLLLFCCFLPTLAGAAEITLDDVVNALETPFKATTVAGIDDFQADFFQESHLASIDRIQRGEGKVSFKFLHRESDGRPVAMFRWEYREPTPQEIIADGQTLWAYQPENRQVIKSDISQLSQQSDNPVTFLSGLSNLSRDFDVRWGAPKNDRNGNYILELQPHRKSQLIHSLKMIVDKDAVSDFLDNRHCGSFFPILATSVNDSNGNRTSIEFHSIRVNTGLSAESFHFVAPEGVEVLRPEDVTGGF